VGMITFRAGQRAILYTPTGDTLNNSKCRDGERRTGSIYVSSSGFGGMDSLVVDGHSPSDTGTVKVELSFGDFTLLQAGTHYTLTGAYGDPNVHSVHKVNHYGTQNLVTQLGVLADSVFRKSGLILKYNDMSLKGGGLSISQTIEHSPSKPSTRCERGYCHYRCKRTRRYQKPISGIWWTRFVEVHW